MFGITMNDVKTVGYNGGIGVAHFAACFAAAYLASKVAQTLLKFFSKEIPGDDAKTATGTVAALFSYQAVSDVLSTHLPLNFKGAVLFKMAGTMVGAGWSFRFY